MDWLDKLSTWLILAVMGLWGLTFGALSKRVGKLEGKVETLQCSQAATDERFRAIEARLTEISDDIKALLRRQ